MLLLKSKIPWTECGLDNRGSNIKTNKQIFENFECVNLKNPEIKPLDKKNLVDKKPLDKETFR